MCYKCVNRKELSHHWLLLLIFTFFLCILAFVSKQDYIDARRDDCWRQGEQKYNTTTDKCYKELKHGKA